MAEPNGLTPQAVPSSMVCSLCGLPWDRHGKRPTAKTCIGLLKEDLARPVLTSGYSHAIPSLMIGGNRVHG